MEYEENELLIDDDFQAPITIDEAEQLKPIVLDFVNSCGDSNAQNGELEDRLTDKMYSYLPEISETEIRSFVKEIIETVNIQESKKRSLDNALKNGKSKESWLAGELQQATSHMTVQQSMSYFNELDTAVKDANIKMYQTIMTKDSLVNQNPNLDGYIAEQYHAQTFNLNAQVRNSNYRASVVEPNGTYNKNGVDIVIKDGNGKTVSRYQSKYCKDAEATAKAFENGDYRGQQKLTPSDQVIDKKATTVLKAPDGTTSNPLSKAQAEQMRDEARSGRWNELNWNEYATKDLAMGIAKQAGKAGILGAAVGAGAEIVGKLMNGEEVSGSEVAEAAIKGGADAGVKAALAGAIKTGAEKGIIKVIPKGTPAGTIANIAFVAVENAKIVYQIATKKLSPLEGLGKMGEVTTSAVAGAVAAAKGTSVGAAVGAVLGPIGAAVGGAVGGIVGYAAGSTVGKAVISGVKAVGKAAVNAVKSVGRAVKNFASGIKNFLFG